MPLFTAATTIKQRRRKRKTKVSTNVQGLVRTSRRLHVPSANLRAILPLISLTTSSTCAFRCNSILPSPSELRRPDAASGSAVLARFKRGSSTACDVRGRDSCRACTCHMRVTPHQGHNSHCKQRRANGRKSRMHTHRIAGPRDRRVHEPARAWDAEGGHQQVRILDMTRQAMLCWTCRSRIPKKGNHLEARWCPQDVRCRGAHACKTRAPKDMLIIHMWHKCVFLHVCV
jgi:hypothetical protein